MPRRPAENLTDGELRLMRILWERGAATVQEVVEGLPGETPLAYNTVLTTMRILEKKGYLEREKEGRAHRYSPTVSREEAQGKAVRQMVRSFFDDSPELLLQSLLQDEHLSPVELERLKRMIEESEGGAR